MGQCGRQLVFLLFSLSYCTNYISSAVAINKRTFWQVGSNGMVYFTLRPIVNENGNAGSNSNSASNQQSTSSTLPQEEGSDRVALQLLNAYRTQHGSQQLTFSPSLKRLATECAAQYNTLKSSSLALLTSGAAVTLNDLPVCQNTALGNDTTVFFAESTQRIPTTAYSTILSDWYEEVDLSDQPYKFDAPANVVEFQHMTQMLWNNTRLFGSSCTSAPLGSPTTPNPPIAGVTTPRPARTYVCSFAFRPGGNVRRRFGPQEFDEYINNVKPIIENNK